MTREVALRKVKGYLTDYFSIKDYNEIEEIMLALEQQPCEDYISREAVKDKLMEIWTKYIPMELDINLSYVLEKISKLPTVTPQQTRWIPVSERSPEECQKVLVTDKFEAVTTAIYFEKSPFWREMVVAWMPLPEPYKESEEKE